MHLEAIGVSCSVLIVNLLLKLLPDTVVPLLGKDSVDERRQALAANAAAEDDPRYSQVQQK